MMNQLRVDIFNAVKYVIPDYFTPAESYGDIGEEDVSRGAEEFRIDLKQCDTIAKMVKRFDDFQYFVRLPFDSIFIENQCFGALVQRRGESGLKITILKQDRKGRTVGPFWAIVDDVESVEYVESIGYCGETIVPTNTRFYVSPAEFAFSFDEDGVETMHNEEAFSEHCDRIDPKNRKTAYEHRMDYVGMIERFFSPLTIVVFNTMVFLNVRNVSVRTVGPSRKEASKLGIAPTAISKYSYRVVDIFRELDPEMMRFEDIEKFIHSEAGFSGVDRRAHAVCGHFKKKHGSLFWWNAHMRNAKNIDRVGYVEKDYRLNEK
jgi:hypothetical protein